MADTSLTEAGWKKFAKGRDLKDAALLKALAVLDKAPPADVPKALDELAKQLDALAKACKADKAVVEHLKALDGELKARRKQALQVAADAAEDEDSPAQLTTKMVPVLRQVRAGEVMNAMVALLGKETVVLVSRRAVGATQRKLLASQLSTTAGVKYIAGQCVFEAEAHTFVLEGPAKGLAKRLKAALLEQTQLRLKVRVRGEGADDVDEDLDDAGADAIVQAPPAQSAQAAESGADAARDQLESRLNAVRSRVQQAVRDQHPSGVKLHALLDFADAKLKAGELRAAEQAFAALVPVLATLASGAAAVPDAKGGTAPRGSPTGAVNYAKARLAWLAVRKKTAADLQTLRQAILAEFGPGASAGEGESEDDEDEDEDLSDVPTEFPDIEERLTHLDKVLETLDEQLADTLDAALNASDPARRAALHTQAQERIAGFLAYVDGDPLLRQIDQNPFVPLTVHATLQATLRTLAATLNT